MLEQGQPLLTRLQAQNPLIVEAILAVARAVQATDSPIPSPPRALLVGGFVRDLLLHLSPTDADIEVYGLEAAAVEPLLNTLFPGQVNLVGRAFGVFKISLGDGYELDVALPRRESKTGVGHKDFAVEGDPALDPKEAARRRDFTMNAILFDPLTGELIDPWNGVEDLRTSTLRMVDADHFGEDPLRVYRAVQFSARFHLTIEEHTVRVLRNMVERGELDHLPPERITEEWRKLLLKAEFPSTGLVHLRELGILEKYAPELQATVDVEQDPEWHPEGDVWIHTCMVVDRAADIIRQQDFSKEERLHIMLGALCHDLGKPATTELAPKQGVMRIRSLGHEAAGAEPTKSFMARFCFGEDATHAAIMAAREHLKPGMLRLQAGKEHWSPAKYKNVVRKLLQRIHPMSWRVLLAISEADYRGRTLPKADDPTYEDGEMFARAAEELEVEGSPLQPLLRGEDLMALGVKAGPRIGELIRMTENERDEGRITTKEEALSFMKEFLKR